MYSSPPPLLPKLAFCEDEVEDDDDDATDDAGGKPAQSDVGVTFHTERDG